MALPSALSVPLSIVRAWARHNQSKFLAAPPGGQFYIGGDNYLGAVDQSGLLALHGDNRRNGRGQAHWSLCGMMAQASF